MARCGRCDGSRWQVQVEQGEVDARQFVWRVAVVEDHRLQRRATVDLLAGQASVRTVWSGESLPQFVDWLERTAISNRPHLLVLDLHVDRGPSADPAMVRELITSGMRVLVFSAMTAPDLVRAMLRVGVTGVVGKRDSERDIIGALWTVLGRGRWMTPELDAVVGQVSTKPDLSDQEARALALYASGLTLDAVARTLGVRPDTAKKYLSRVKAKYAAVGRDVRTKVDMNAAARQDGFITGQEGQESSHS